LTNLVPDEEFKIPQKLPRGGGNFSGTNKIYRFVSMLTGNRLHAGIKLVDDGGISDRKFLQIALRPATDKSRRSQRLTLTHGGYPPHYSFSSDLVVDSLFFLLSNYESL
jgi:hypothetical protein